jgi:hypothetical protein
MSVPGKGFFVRALALLLTGSGAWLVGHLAAAPEKRPPPPAEVTYTEAEYAAATQVVEQRLAPWAQQALREGKHASGPVLLFLVRDADRRSCEDLSRQLRELRRRAPRDLPLVVWTGKNDTAPMEAFFRRERVEVAVLEGVEIDSLFAGGDPVVTPATVVVGEDGMARGIAHSARFPGTRPRSFAQELGFVN